MKAIEYDRGHALELLPLLDAIGREIRERTEALEQIESHIDELRSQPFTNLDEVQQLQSEASNHRRGLKIARQELDRLGCSVVGMEPLTFRIPGKVGAAKTSFVWQTGERALK
jgi:hypothetical protein